MPNSRKNNKKGGSFIGIIFALVVISAILFAWAKANDINSPSDIPEYFQEKGKQAKECSANDWKCLDEKGESTPDVKPKEKLDNAASLQKKLDKIPTNNGDKIKYNRADWKHWVGSPCNSREETLKNQGKKVKADDDCKILSGEWIDPYTGDKITEPRKLDIDHVIPLEYAASHGGNNWNPEMKIKFANDSSQLIASGQSPNRSKGSKGPGEWIPDNKDFHCKYAKLWVNTASKYSLGIEKEDKAALSKTIKNCS